MLNLDSHLTIDAAAIKSPNLCDRFDSDDLDRIGLCVWEGYDHDRYSRMSWERRTDSAMELALQIQKDKNFPWPNCSNVTFPLITIAVLQFHARAYPAIINGTEVVKCRVIGEDPEGKKIERADRISTHMSYQVLEEDCTWESEHDKLLINLAVVGTTFVKTRYDSNKAHSVSECVVARDLVLNYWAKSVDECERKTHVIPLTRNEIHERVLRGVFRDILDEGWYKAVHNPIQTPSDIKTDRNAGTLQPQSDHTTPFMALEQHCSLDLDGDGYCEPYIITIDEQSKKVLRIVTRFDREEDIERVSSGQRKGQIISIRPMEYFTQYTFIPSPDGGVYGIGFGVLTGPLNESVNSLVNQLIDAGTMANGGGGFLGRGAKIRGGAYTFSPFEWKRVDSTGDDLRKSIVPLTVKEPSGVLLQLLSLLIDYTNRISGSTDTMVGENPGQNTPAETSRTMVEQGTKIYTAIFKRIWRSMKEEFKKRYVLNALYMPARQSFGSAGAFALREDYLGDPSAVVPAADPNITSDTQRQQQALMLKQAAMTTPGYDRDKVERRFLAAMHVDGIDVIYPGPDKTPPLPNPKMQIEEAKLKGKQMQIQAEQMRFAMQMQEDKRLNDAKIMELHAKAAFEMEQAGGVQQGQKIAAFEAAIGAMKLHSANLDRQTKVLLERMKNDRESSDNGGAVSGMADQSGNTGAPTPDGGMAG